jgi:hypothetical protein
MIAANWARVISYVLIRKALTALVFVAVASLWNVPAGTEIMFKLKVSGNTAVTTPELTTFVAVAPATVKLFVVTPVRVYPALAVSVIVAVYTVFAVKVSGVPDHTIVPVYCAVGVIVVTGVAPVPGGVTPGIAAMFITVSCAASVVELTEFWHPSNNRQAVIASINP